MTSGGTRSQYSDRLLALASKASGNPDMLFRHLGKQSDSIKLNLELKLDLPLEGAGGQKIHHRSPSE
jgi:hypothetical protein